MGSVCGMDSLASGQGPVVGSYEHDELLGTGTMELVRHHAYTHTKRKCAKKTRGNGCNCSEKSEGRLLLLLLLLLHVLDFCPLRLLKFDLAISS
jgi:hypothetical protein